MLNTSRSYSRPNTSSSQRHRLLQRAPSRGRICPRRRGAPRSRARTSRPERVVKRSRDRDQIAGDQREQVGRLRVRIDPAWPSARPSPASPAPTGLPFDSSTGTRALSARDRHGVARHHVGPVGEIGDAAEALGLALGAEIAARGVEAGERGVALRRDARQRLQHRRVGQAGDAAATPSAREGQPRRREHRAVELRAPPASARRRPGAAARPPRRPGCGAAPAAPARWSMPDRGRSRAPTVSTRKAGGA